MQEARRLEGRVAVITGGGSGIGRAVALRFAREGAAALTLVDRDTDRLGESADLVAREGVEHGVAVHTVTADVTDETAPTATVDAILAQSGRLDVVLTAAGMSVGRSLVDTEPDEWDSVFAVNVKGTYLWLRAALRPMLEAGSGSAITIASQLAVNGGIGNAAYIASKGAIVALTRTTANDCADRGVRVNSILPGATETPLLERSFARNPDPDAARARSLARHPLGRFAQPEEIAAAAAYLASDDAGFVTGTELRVDGGWISG